MLEADGICFGIPGRKTTVSPCLSCLSLSHRIESGSLSMKQWRWTSCSFHCLQPPLAGNLVNACFSFRSAPRSRIIGIHNCPIYLMVQGLLQGDSAININARDTISHYVLRLAFCHTEDLRRWFLAQECELFSWRFNAMPSHEQVWSLLKFNLAIGFLTCVVFSLKARSTDRSFNTYLDVCPLVTCSSIWYVL